MIAKILLIVAALVVVFIIVAALQPADFRVERSITIAAPAAIPFAQLNDLNKWQEISPFAKLDLKAKYTFTSQTVGEGASMAWAGNAQIGAGRMTIIASKPNELIRMRMDFEKPFKGTSTADYTFTSTAGNQTTVRWSLNGTKNFISKAMGLIVSMDRMMGSQFEEGLATLKSLSEANASRD